MTSNDSRNFYDLVSTSQTLLRVRREWHGPATAHADIEAAVNQMAALMSLESFYEQAVSEIKRRSGQ